MPKHRGQIHPDQAVDWAPVETNKAVVGWAMVTAGAAGVLGWWVLRHPEWRAFLVQLVPHRYPIAFAYERQILAPRSLAIGGVVFTIIGFIKIIISKQYNLMSLIKRTEILTHVFVSLQALLAFTVIINLNLYFVRTFQTFPCNLSEDRLLTHWAPQAYPHARQLRQQLKDDATVAVHAEGGTFNLYLFSAFAYPVRCFYAAALDKASSEPHKQKQPHSAVQLDYYLHYDPFCTTSPFSLRRLAFP